MLDCISEEGFWGQDENGQEDGGQNYFNYIPSGCSKRIEQPIDHDYYHTWEYLKNIREYATNYSAVFEYKDVRLLLSIPKKIVRGTGDNKLFVHTKIFYNIVHKCYNKYLESTKENNMSDKETILHLREQIKKLKIEQATKALESLLENDGELLNYIRATDAEMYSQLKKWFGK